MKHDILSDKSTNPSFSRAALLAEPSLVAVACYLARVAVEEDLKTLSADSQKSYAVRGKGGPA